MFHYLVQNHARHVRLKLSKRSNLVNAQLLAQDWVCIFANGEYLLCRHYVAFLHEERRGDEVELWLVNSPFEGEITYNWHIADNSVEFGGALATLRFLEIVVGELRDRGEDLDDVSWHCVNVFDLVLIDCLHLLRYQSGDFVLTDELVI